MTTDQLRSVTTPDGVTLRYLETGTGDPPILFIHGWCCNNTYWRDQVPHFAKKHRVIGVDLRGHGESDKPDQDYTVDGFADDTAWLIGELKLRKPVIIGHSMGGSIALSLVRKHPHLAGAVVFVDSPIFPLPEPTQALADQTLAALQTPAYRGVAAGFVRMVMFNADSPPNLIEEIVSGMSSATQRVMYTAIADTFREESMLAGSVPVPSLFIRAATHFATEDAIRERYPGMSVITVPGSAHFLQMEQPAATNKIINDFLDKLE